MKTYLTQFQAIDVNTGELNDYAGDMIEAFSHEDAQEWCNENAPYLFVVGELQQIRDDDGNIIEDSQNAKLN